MANEGYPSYPEALWRQILFCLALAFRRLYRHTIPTTITTVDSTATATDITDALSAVVELVILIGSGATITPA